MRLVRHDKTGNIYIVINDNVIDCTNTENYKRKILYCNLNDKMFVRDYDEFYIKFSACLIENRIK